MAIWKRSDNWLAGIGAADHSNHTISELMGLTPEQAQDAFDATYGKGQFRATGHGTVITVWSRRGHCAHLRRYEANARERGQHDYADELAEKIRKIETGELFG